MVGSGHTGKYNLLLVEDDPIDQKWLNALLARIPDFDFNFTWAQTYEEADSLLSSLVFDLALVDYAIGPRSGVDLLTKFGGRAAQTPMVMLTGNTNHDADITAMKAGAYDYLNKGKLDEWQLERTLRYVGETRKLELDLKRARDKAQAADEAKASFLSNMSHDLRTPLNAIIGFSEIILGDGSVNGETLDYLRLIHSSGKHLATMINDIMMLTQFQSNKVDVRKQKCDLAALMPTVVSATKYAATERNVDVVVKGCDKEFFVDADEDAVHRMLVNILASACDLSETGEVLSITMAEDANGTSVAVEGMCDRLSAVPLMQMTQPFRVPSKDYAADSVYRIGLSLAIAYRIAQLHDAVLDVNSGDDGKTCFRVMFPSSSNKVEMIRVS